MITLFIKYALVSLICWLTGEALFQNRQRETASFGLKIFVGAAGIAFFISVWSIFFPIYHWLQFFAAGAAIAYFFSQKNLRTAFQFDKKRLQNAWVEASFWVATGLFLLYFSALQTSSVDELQYHLPFIKWLNEFGAVPGLGNIERRIGFNSNWHLLAAFFNWRWLGRGEMTQLNPVFYLAFIGFAFDFARRHEGFKRFLALASVASLFFPWMSWIYLPAPTPDFAVLVFSAVICLLFLEIISPSPPPPIFYLNN